MKAKNPILILAPVVFLCGASLMALELIASRILAPYLGNTFYIWTSIIGVILLSLSLGYWIGGIVADKKASYKILSLIVFLSSISVVIIYFIQSPVLNWLSKSSDDLRVTSVLASIILFLAPSVILGMVSPYAAKLALRNISNSGRTVGNLYALSTAGSIAGTFLAGFWLIPSYGTSYNIILIAMTLFICSMLRPLSYILLKITVVFLVVLLLSVVDVSKDNFGNNTLVADFDSHYSRIQIIDGIYSNHLARRLITDRGASQSGIFLDGNGGLLFEYTKYYELAGNMSPNKRLLMIGGGALVYPTYHLKKYSESSMDVVEIDPKMIETARDYFSFKDSDRLKIYNMDGRVYLNRNRQKYDAVLMDAFKSYSPPFQLTTRESLQKVYDALDQDGVFIGNLISSLQDKNSEFLCSEYMTTKKVFPKVAIYQINKNHDSLSLQNLVLLAFKDEKRTIPSDSPFYENLLEESYLDANCGGAGILTDDFAPVDTMISI